MDLDGLIDASAERVDLLCMDYGGHDDLGVRFELPAAVAPSAPMHRTNMAMDAFVVYPDDEQGVLTLAHGFRGSIRICGSALIGTAILKDGPRKCECGSATCGSAAHSDWCPAR